jgi:hypothetical protein
MKFIYFAIIALFLASCTNYLDKGPLTSLSSVQYWTSEASIRTFSWGFLSGNTSTGVFGNYFFGYGQNYSYGPYYENLGGAPTSDDYAGGGNIFATTVPNTGAWNYAWVRKANIFIASVKTATGINDSTRNHWLGVGRFFRALAYELIIQSYGDCPYYNTVVDQSQTALLYKPRDPRSLVVDSMIADFDYAIAHTRVSEVTLGYPQGTTITRDVEAAFASRIMLYEASVFRYYPAVFGYDKSKASGYYQKARQYALDVINSGRYSINNSTVSGGGDPLRSLFVSYNLAGNSEVIMYRSYASGIVSHSVESYCAYQNAQVGISKNLLDAFLCKDGLPQKQSPTINLDPTSSSFSYRKFKTGTSLLDPRIGSTICPDSLRLQSAAFTGANGDADYALTGMAIRKFLNDNDYYTASLNTNLTAAPIVCYDEVLLNYAEACAEIVNTSISGNVPVPIAQSDLDISINKLRDRLMIAMPHLQVIGGYPAVNNVMINDPDRDVNPDGTSYEVPPMIWEIRRERRIELALEGFRFYDLMRWGKLHYMDYTRIPQLTVNRGAWINMSTGLDPKTGNSSSLTYKLKPLLAANNIDNTVATPWLGTTGIPGGGGGPASGYILYSTSSTTITSRAFKSNGFGSGTMSGLEVYLSPIGKDQFTLYQNAGYGNNITQNPGWTGR